MTLTTGTVSAAPDAALATVALTPDRAILRDDQRVHAERIRAAQAGAEVVRIGHAVEHQQQRRLGRAFEDIFQRNVRQRTVDDGDDALVPLVPGHGLQAPFVDGLHVDRRGLGALDQFAHAAIAARGVDVKRLYAFRVIPQARNDRVEAEQEAGGFHGGTSAKPRV